LAAKKASAKTATRAKSRSKTTATRKKSSVKSTESMNKVALTSTKRGSLKQTSIFILTGITAVILLALITYNPADPGLFHYDSNAVIQNKAGSAGAYLADVLIGFFGFLAYLIPVSFIVSAFLIFRSSKEKNNGINLGITLFGVFLALIAGCGLATLLWPESYLSHTSGGLLGHGIARMFVRMLGDIGATMILFSGFIAGITLFADIQWLKLIDKIGDGIMSIIELLTTTNGVGPQQSYETSAGSLPVETLDQQINKDVSHNASNSNVSIFGAVATGLSGMFLWKKSSANNGEGFQKPMFDALGDGMERSSTRQDPILGVPDFAARDLGKYEDTQQTDVSVKGLEDVITATRAAIASPKKIVERLKAKPKQKPQSKPQKTEEALVEPTKNKMPQEAISLDKALTLPPVSLLNPPPADQGHFSKEELEMHARNIIETLESFKINGVKIDSYYPGPIITRFELLLPPGTKVSRITSLAQDMARTMCVSSIRVGEVIPGKTTIGIEGPNEKRDLVSISEILDSDVFRESKSPLTMVLGKTIEGNPAVADLGRMPHLLIAGTTGSGKSVGVNAMLISLLYKATPDEVKLILIDPKMLELSIYEGIPHLLTPVVTDMKDAANGLRWAVGEMERRYALMSHMKVRGIAGYNEKVKAAIDKGEPIMDPTFDPTLHVDVRPKILEPLPYIVIVIDEFADMMMVVGKKVEELIARLAQKARASGIHLILATQRPSVDVITGLIKANIPTRIAFQVSTKIDSRTILDQGGAETLLGHGDMLYLPPGTGLSQRVHGAFVADQEVEDVVNYLKLQGEPEYLTDVIEDTGSSDAIPGLEPLEDTESDALYDQAVAIVTESRRASISYVQRRLKVGYNRAASMIEDMERAGVVSAVQSNGTREVLAPEPVRD
jgi:S-DNA-T family DNA segregation ATPase FtsK/SpoIIIE